MAFATSINSSMFADISVHVPLTPLSPAALAINSEENFKSLFSTEIKSVGGTPSINTFCRIEHIREFPELGTPPNIVKVPEYGAKMSRQVNGQADSPDISINLNYVPSDWAAGTLLGDLVGSGQQVVIRATLMSSEPQGSSNSNKKFSTAGIGTVRNSQWYFVGRLESIVVMPNLTDAVTAKLAVTMQTDFYGAWTTTSNNAAPVAPPLTGEGPFHTMVRFPVGASTTILLPEAVRGWADADGDAMFPAVPTSAQANDTVSVDANDFISLTATVPGVRKISYEVQDGMGGSVSTSLLASLAYKETDDILLSTITAVAPFTVTTQKAAGVVDIAVAAGSAAAVVVSASLTGDYFTIGRCYLSANGTAGTVKLVYAANATEALTAGAALTFTTTADLVSGWQSVKQINRSPVAKLLYLVTDGNFVGNVQLTAALSSVARAAPGAAV